MFGAIGLWIEKKRAFVGTNVSWNVKTRGFVGPDVRGAVKTRGFVDPCVWVGDEFSAPEAEAAPEPAGLPAPNTEPINEQKQAIGSNEVAIAPEETPAESIKTKRRGWWQRGGLF